VVNGGRHRVLPTLIPNAATRGRGGGDGGRAHGRGQRSCAVSAAPSELEASDSSITRNSIFGIEKQGSNAVASFGGNTVFSDVGNTFALTQGKL
jgi:hypothetical protein